MYQLSTVNKKKKKSDFQHLLRILNLNLNKDNKLMLRLAQALFFLFRSKNKLNNCTLL